MSFIESDKLNNLRMQMIAVSAFLIVIPAILLIFIGSTSKIGAAICLVILLFGIALIISLGHHYTHVIEEVKLAFEKMARKDYSIKLEHHKYLDPKLKHLAQTYNAMSEKAEDNAKKIQKSLNRVALISEGLSASSEEVNASTEQVASSIQEIARGSQNQSELVGTTAQVIKELNESIANVSSNLKSVSESAGRANDNAKKGKESAGIANQKMQNIKDTVSDVGTSVRELGSKSTEIGKIVDVINSISEQTNLLALNAAIEAARAGQAGKGFAVVAEEIRKLAEESSKSTQQIGDLIQGIQSYTSMTVDSIETSIKTVDEGSQTVSEALISLEGISAIINALTNQLHQVVEQSKAQIELTGKVDRAMAEVSTVAEESVAGGEEVSASVEEITSSMQEVASNALELTKATEELKAAVGHAN